MNGPPPTALITDTISPPAPPLRSVALGPANKEHSGVIPENLMQRFSPAEVLLKREMRGVGCSAP